MKAAGHTSTEGKAHVVKMSEGKAFDYFFRQYYTALCFFANSIIHNEDESKDIVQDCFVKLWHKRTVIKDHSTIKSFLYTVVRNACINKLKKQKIHDRKDNDIRNIVGDQDSTWLDKVVHAEILREIFQLIDILPLRMQQVFKMHFFEGKNYQQIADELHTSTETVRKQKAKALNLIRDKFGKIAFLLFFL